MASSWLLRCAGTWVTHAILIALLGVLVFASVMFLDFDPTRIVLSLLAGIVTVAYLFGISWRTLCESLGRTVLLTAIPFVSLALWPDKYRNCDCDYCMDLAALRTVFEEADMPPQRWATQHGLTGRPALIRLADFESRLSHFSWSNLNWSEATRAFRVINSRGPDGQTSPSLSSKPERPNSYARRLLSQLPNPRGVVRSHDAYLSWTMQKLSWSPAQHKRLSRQLGIEKLPFLPAEWSVVEPIWIFLGYIASRRTLQGSESHKDAVGTAGTFHVQLFGSKQWHLEPMPHCTASCGTSVIITARAGQVLTLNTDKWYHSTTLPSQKELPITLSVAGEYTP